MPTACSLPPAAGDIRTKLHAGGMTSDLILSSCASSVIGCRSYVMYRNPLFIEPRRRHHFERRPLSTSRCAAALSIHVLEDSILRPAICKEHYYPDLL